MYIQNGGGGKQLFMCSPFVTRAYGGSVTVESNLDHNVLILWVENTYLVSLHINHITVILTFNRGQRKFTKAVSDNIRSK